MKYLQFFSALLTTTNNDPNSSTSINNIPTGTAADTVANTLGVTYLIAGIVAVLVIIFAGYSYVTSSGDASKVKRAKDALTYAIIGIIVIMLAFVITQFVVGRF